MLTNKMPILSRIIAALGFFFMIAWQSPPARGQANSAVHPRNTSHKVLSQSMQRVVFDSSAFMTRGVPIPYFDKGYLVSRKVESFAPGTPNVMLYGKDGQKVREAAIWFPQSVRVAITSAAVTSDGRIIASGEADKEDGTRAPFIALTDLSGKVTVAIQTKDFYPTNVCVGPDDTAWSFGSTWWDDVNHHPLPGDLLRHFDFQKGQLAGYIPRSTFPDPSSPDTMTLMRCSSTGIAIYSGPEDTYIAMPYEGNGPHIYRASTPARFMMTGLAVIGEQAYGALINHEKADDPTQGLYLLGLDDAAKTVRWLPVEGAVGARRDPETIVRLWGADRDDLVVNRGDDPAGLSAVHWATVSDK